MKDFKNQNNKGFTLIELTISSSILAVIFIGIIIFGINTIRSYQRTQALKNTVEDARYAIEVINKTIRTSHKINGDSSELFILDNLTEKSHCYKFDGSVLKRKIGDSSASNCGEIGEAFIKIVGSNEITVTGTFEIKETDRDDDERGFVRTNIKLKYTASAQDNFENDEVILQSSVSLRDYGFNL